MAHRRTARAPANPDRELRRLSQFRLSCGLRITAHNREQEENKQDKDVDLPKTATGALTAPFVFLVSALAWQAGILGEV